MARTPELRHHRPRLANVVIPDQHAHPGRLAGRPCGDGGMMPPVVQGHTSGGKYDECFSGSNGGRTPPFALTAANHCKA
jgi:hypothetical protein